MRKWGKESREGEKKEGKERGKEKSERTGEQNRERDSEAHVRHTLCIEGGVRSAINIRRKRGGIVNKLKAKYSINPNVSLQLVPFSYQKPFPLPAGDARLPRHRQPPVLAPAREG